MRDEQRFEIERALDLIPHVIGASWAVIWFRLNKIKNPSREEFHKKVIEYLELLTPLFNSLPEKENFQEINSYIKQRWKNEIEKISDGKNKEIEIRYDRYLDYG